MQGGCEATAGRQESGVGERVIEWSRGAARKVKDDQGNATTTQAAEYKTTNPVLHILVFYLLMLELCVTLAQAIYRQMATIGEIHSDLVYMS